MNNKHKLSLQVYLNKYLIFPMSDVQYSVEPDILNQKSVKAISKNIVDIE